MSPIEAAAKAAYEERWKPRRALTDWSALSESYRAREIAAFKAGLKAIREPTETTEHVADVSDRYIREDVRVVFSAVIDALTGEG